MTEQVSWGLAEGEAITPELTFLRKLGGGSAYEAVLAFDEVTYSPVVVKLVRPDQVASRSTLRGLRREAELLEQTRHPAVVRMLRAVDEGDRPHIVLEQLDGPRLSSLIRRHGPLEAHQFLPLGIEVAAALHYLHGLGVVHLDVKPSNIIMGAPAKLIDLSVARRVEQAENLGYVVGTDGYLAPEQARGRPEPASDVWAIGAVLFKAISGERPFQDPPADYTSNDVEAAELLPQVIDDPRPLPEQIPADLAKIVLTCLAREPSARPTPAEVSDTLGPMLARVPRGKLRFKVR